MPPELEFHRYVSVFLRQRFRQAILEQSVLRTHERTERAARVDVRVVLFSMDVTAMSSTRWTASDTHIQSEPWLELSENILISVIKRSTGKRTTLKLLSHNIYMRNTWLEGRGISAKPRSRDSDNLPLNHQPTWIPLDHTPFWGGTRDY